MGRFPYYNRFLSGVQRILILPHNRLPRYLVWSITRYLGRYLILYSFQRKTIPVPIEFEREKIMQNYIPVPVLGRLDIWHFLISDGGRGSDIWQSNPEIKKGLISGVSRIPFRKVTRKIWNIIDYDKWFLNYRDLSKLQGTATFLRNYRYQISCTSDREYTSIYTQTDWQDEL